MGATDASAGRWPTARSKVYSPGPLGEPGAALHGEPALWVAPRYPHQPSWCQIRPPHRISLSRARLRRRRAGARVEGRIAQLIRAGHGSTHGASSIPPCTTTVSDLSITPGPSKRRGLVEADSRNRRCQVELSYIRRLHIGVDRRSHWPGCRRRRSHPQRLRYRDRGCTWPRCGSASLWDSLRGYRCRPLGRHGSA